MTNSNPPGRVKLSGRQWQMLLKALNNAFNYQELQRLLRFEMDLDLEDISFQAPMPNVLYDVITFTEARNRTMELVEAAHRNRSNVPEIFNVAQELGIAPASDILERILREEDHLFDVALFRQRMAALERQICRIEIGGPLGTGFLVGPSTLLTNYHVMESIIKDDGAEAGKMLFRFDYKVLDDGTTINSGTVHRLAGNAIEDWLLDMSPYSSVDATPEPKPSDPERDQLDYALLKLEGLPAEDLLGEPSLSIERGFIELPAADVSYDFSANKVLFIVQHPLGDPLKITSNTFRSLNGNGTRVTYLNNTEPGSSGSPCFNANWELVALHHSGDPEYSQAGKFNQGIPISMIVQLLEQRGKLEIVSQ